MQRRVEVKFPQVTSSYQIQAPAEITPGTERRGRIRERGRGRLSRSRDIPLSYRATATHSAGWHLVTAPYVPETCKCRDDAKISSRIHLLDALFALVHAVAQVVQALRHRPEGRRFDSRGCHWNFSLT